MLVKHQQNPLPLHQMDEYLNSGDWRYATMPDVLQFSAAVEKIFYPCLVELADCKCNQLAVRCDRQKKDCYLEMGSTASTLMMVTLW